MRIQKSEKQLWAFIKSWGHRIALTKRTNFALKLRFPVNIRDLIFWKLWLRALTLDFHDIHWLESEFHYFGETLMIMFPSSKFAFVSTAGSSSITAKIAAALFHWFCGFFHFNRCLTLLFIVTSRYKVARSPVPYLHILNSRRRVSANAVIKILHFPWFVYTLFNVYPTNPSERGLYTNEDVLFIRA